MKQQQAIENLSYILKTVVPPNAESEWLISNGAEPKRNPGALHPRRRGTISLLFACFAFIPFSSQNVCQ
jgi:hypothetical protein